MDIGFGLGLQQGDGWMNDPDIKLFDSNEFRSELAQLNSDEGTTVTEQQYSNFLEFLTQIANAHLEFGQKTSLQGDQSMLHSGLDGVTGELVLLEALNTEQVLNCVQTLVQEDHCRNILVFVSVMKKDNIDFTVVSQELQDAVDGVCVETVAVKGDQPILLL